MSIYSLMTFNSAVDKFRQNEKDTQDIQAAKLKNQQSAEELDITKKLDLAKAKDARNQGMISDYVGDALEKHINEQYKPKQDALQAGSDLADLKLHQTQQQNTQLTGAMKQLHDSDPDVQNHVSSMLGAIKQTNQPSGYPSDVNPATGGESNQTQMSMAPQASSGVPSIVPQQPAQPMPAQVQPAQPVPQAAAAPEDTSMPTQDQPAAPAEKQSNGIDLSPMEQALGMPSGSLWLNPSTAKPEISPVWKSRIEAQQRAQANYDVNQPFRDEQREDKNLKTAESYLVNALKQRGGAVGIQNNKVDSAIHARQLIDAAYDPKSGNYNLTQVPYSELSETLGNLLSGSSGMSEGRVFALKQKTAQGDLNGAITYITGKPSNATSQEAIKQLVGMVDRQGLISEDLRDKAIEKLKGLSTFKRLDPEDFENLKQQHFGNSFKEELAKSPDKQPTPEQKSNVQIPANRPAGAKHYSPSTKKFYDAKGNEL